MWWKAAFALYGAIWVVRFVFVWLTPVKIEEEAPVAPPLKKDVPDKGHPTSLPAVPPPEEEFGDF